MSTGWNINGPNVRGRKCGGCTLCCTLLPVVSLGKTGGQRCKHLCSRGCRIYERRPIDCRFFSCRWLMDETTAGMRRPDKVGYVVDPMTDTVLADGEPIDVVQVWVANPDAHKDEGLRRWLEYVAERHGLPALIREDETVGWVLFAPSMTNGQGWVEHRSNSVSVPSEDMEDLRKAARERWFGEKERDQ